MGERERGEAESGGEWVDEEYKFPADAVGTDTDRERQEGGPTGKTPGVNNYV